MEGMPTRWTASVSQKLLPEVRDAFSSVVSSVALARRSTMVLLRCGRGWCSVVGNTLQHSVLSASDALREVAKRRHVLRGGLVAGMRRHLHQVARRAELVGAAV